MRKLLWSPQPLRDLEGIRDYIAIDSARYAVLVIERIVNGVERLSSFPESGRMVPEHNDPSIREVIVKPYSCGLQAQAWARRDRDGLSGVAHVSGTGIGSSGRTSGIWTPPVKKKS